MIRRSCFASCLLFLLVVAGLCATAFAQTGGESSNATAKSSEKSDELTIPAGTKVPVALKHAISTKGSRDGDAVYAETTFPVVVNGRVLIPAGTYVQGRISHIQQAGRIKNKAQVLMHFTTLIYPTGYTVVMPGSLENAPGVENTKVKDQEGTLTGDGKTAEKIGTVASTTASGTVIGAATGGGKGALIGAGIGGAVGTAIALLTRGNDVKMDAGTTIEMIIQRDVPLDATRVPNVTRSATTP